MSIVLDRDQKLRQWIYSRHEGNPSAVRRRKILFTLNYPLLLRCINTVHPWSNNTLISIIWGIILHNIIYCIISINIVFLWIMGTWGTRLRTWSLDNRSRFGVVQVLWVGTDVWSDAMRFWMLHSVIPDVETGCGTQGIIQKEFGGRYQLDFQAAADLCQSLGTTLATLDQLKRAHAEGYETCR